MQKGDATDAIGSEDGCAWLALSALEMIEDLLGLERMLLDSYIV